MTPILLRFVDVVAFLSLAFALWVLREVGRSGDDMTRSGSRAIAACLTFSVAWFVARWGTW